VRVRLPLFLVLSSVSTLAQGAAFALTA
jgi:hypothetical protein